MKTRVREHGCERSGRARDSEQHRHGRIRDAQVVEGADIVYSRRLDEDANLESLLLALAELRDKGWHAVVIGDGPDRDR